MASDIPARPPERGRAFTLLETILVVAIVGLLIALLSPSLASVRAQALRVKTVSNLGQTAKIMHVYTGDWQDSWPWFADPKATETYIRLADGRTCRIQHYFDSFIDWPWALADHYLDGKVHPSYIYDAEQVARFGRGGSPFELSCTLFTDPAFWKPETRTGSDQYRAVRQHEALFPSSKVLLLSSFHLFSFPYLYGDEKIRFPVAMLDGSASVRYSDGLRAGYPQAEMSFPGAFHNIDLGGGAHTIDGVRGRDLR